MMNTVKAIVKEGQIELMEPVDIPEGTEVLVTILVDEAAFWLKAREESLAQYGLTMKMMFMSSYLKGEAILVRYPFSDLSGSKVRPAVIVNVSHPSKDFFILPLISKTSFLLPGEFILSDWRPEC